MKRIIGRCGEATGVPGRSGSNSPHDVSKFPPMTQIFWRDLPLIPRPEFENEIPSGRLFILAGVISWPRETLRSLTRGGGTETQFLTPSPFPNWIEENQAEFDRELSFRLSCLRVHAVSRLRWRPEGIPIGNGSCCRKCWWIIAMCRVPYMQRQRTRLKVSGRSVKKMTEISQFFTTHLQLTPWHDPR